MTYRRAAAPALVGALLLTVLLWWAGASADALRLPGATRVFGIEGTAELGRWLTPWAYDPPASVHDELYATALQIRFVAVFAFFVAGALLLLRGLPPVYGRTSATLLALWAWGLVAGTLAVTVSAPWLIAAQGHGSFRFLPNLASVISSGRQVVVGAALIAAVVTVLVARITAKGAGPLPQEGVPVRAARLAATAGTAVIALSLLFLSYQPVAAALQTAPLGTGFFTEPGDLLRQWLLLGAWDWPTGATLGDWFLYRAADVLLLAVVWWALRLLPRLLTRATFPAIAAGAVCATVLGLLASQLLRMILDGASPRSGLLYLSADLGAGVPAALTWGLVAGAAATVTLRTAGGRARTADPTATTREAEKP
ncbi:hypothetical protein [Streptomyces ipomoeae]|uniref:hypothetical protein n=1 Tax=Streptomyces ipomoeae TaxID=103232 RepID=UPI001146F687|nr:hypothetical protein [Streptomyces ipomoeae]MDX2936022.1 hypothetical protein [Streptomyces ipomoeae]TQE14723.1 hypothetical protein SipoB123_45720 [Streptomyces ipomoeae]